MSISVSAFAGAGNGNACRSALVLILWSTARWADWPCISASNDLHEIQIADRVFLKALHHVLEHVEGLALVFD